jgi:tetratricopeptide (TPR) repeat protein/peptidoglycan hydrolase-like protein with peptidoglycan-binding domain
MSKPRPAKIRSWQVTLILTLFFIAVAGAAGIGWWYARESPAHQGPIVLISVDGLAAERIPGKLEAADARTAAADATNQDAGAIAALAADAVVFERAYTHSAQMLPAHASMLSGQLPFEHGVRDDAGFVLDDNVRTLAELLRNRGFGTGAAVSSFLLRRDTGVGRGFSFYGSPEGTEGVATEPAAAAAPAPAGLSKSDIAPASAATPPVTADTATPEPDTIELATKWAANQRGRRYFLMLQVDAADAERAVGRIVELLRTRRQYDDATIVLVGDRGQTAGQFDEDTLHVPLMVKQPQREGAGRYVDEPVQHIDVLPTILDLVRAPIPGGIKGRSLKPLLTETDGRVEPQPIYSEALGDAFRFGGNPLFALTMNDLRYVRSSVESRVRIGGGGAPAPDPSAADASAEMPPLRATLDRLISGRRVPRASVVPARDRLRLALAGALTGLQQIDAESTLTEQEQQAIATAHREAAVAVGQRRLPAAVRTLQQIARTHPTLAAVHYQIGLLSSELGRTPDAIDAFEAAAALRPDSPEVLTALALALAPSQPADAQSRIDQAIESAAVLGPTEIAAVHEAATRIALARGDAEQAEKHAEAVQAARPEVPMRAFVQGWLLAEAKNDAEAERVLQEAAAMLRQHDMALEGVQLTLGQVLLARDKPVDAEAAFRAELTDYPTSVAAFTGLARALHASEKLVEADQTIATLLASAPTPEGYAAAIRLYTAFGNPARAAELRSDARGRFPAESSMARAGRVKPQ